MSIFWTPLLLEIPVLMFFLAKTQQITWKKYLSWWKYAFVISLVGAVLISPNMEPVTQLFVAGPLCTMYILGIVCARFA